uniref:Uncharacterized protein n=1 Tax=Rhizophora mucronata TaxID=61149 RepID=A0A2P2QUG0_RHIMU
MPWLGLPPTKIFHCYLICPSLFSLLWQHFLVYFLL